LFGVGARVRRGQTPAPDNDDKSPEELVEARFDELKAAMKEVHAGSHTPRLGLQRCPLILEPSIYPSDLSKSL
jgi:hypothetical protein